MFSEANNISFEILSVLELSWQQKKEIPTPRPYPLISFRKTGSANIFYKNEYIHIGNNEFMFVPAFCEYSIESGFEEIIVIHLSSSSVLPNKIITFKPKSPYYLKRKFEDIYSVWSRKQVGYQYDCKADLYKILSTVQKELSSTVISQNADKIATATEYIHENFLNKNLSVSSLAQLCSMSDTYFRKFFYQTHSTTPLRYINTLKLNYALELLDSNYYTIGEIADKCGFDNVYYFSNFIKKETGRTPTYYKKSK